MGLSSRRQVSNKRFSKSDPHIGSDWPLLDQVGVEDKWLTQSWSYKMNGTEITTKILLAISAWLYVTNQVTVPNVLMVLAGGGIAYQIFTT